MIESKIWDERKMEAKKAKKKDKKKGDNVISLYNKVCNHFGFNYNYKERKTPGSVNIIYNMYEKPEKIYVIAAR